MVAFLQPLYTVIDSASDAAVISSNPHGASFSLSVLLVEARCIGVGEQIRSQGSPPAVSLPSSIFFDAV